MSQGWDGEEARLDDPGGSARALGALRQGLVAAIPVVLTVLLAGFLAMQEEVLVAQRGAVVTATAPLPIPTATILVAPALSTEIQPTATLSSTPVPRTSTETPTRARPRRTTAPPACVKRGDWVSYTILRGDTLSSIAARYGLSVQALKEGNCLNTDRIYAGGTLLVPWLPPSEPTQRPSPRPRPTRTSSPTPKPTAIGSETPSPTATEAPTGEPGTNTPTLVPPTATLEPTNTPRPPTSTPTPIPPTSTPEPTHTPPPPTNTAAPPTATPSG